MKGERSAKPKTQFLVFGNADPHPVFWKYRQSRNASWNKRAWQVAAKDYRDAWRSSRHRRASLANCCLRLSRELNLTSERTQARISTESVCP